MSEEGKEEIKQEPIKTGPRWLNRMCREKQKVTVSFVDGEKLTGTILCVGRYEFDFECDGEEYMFFKHAIKHIQYENNNE